MWDKIKKEKNERTFRQMIDMARKQWRRVRFQRTQILQQKQNIKEANTEIKKEATKIAMRALEEKYDIENKFFEISKIKNTLLIQAYEKDIQYRGLAQIRRKELEHTELLKSIVYDIIAEIPPERAIQYIQKIPI